MTGHAARQANSQQAHLRPRLVVRLTVGDIGRLLVEGWRETEVAATKAAAGGGQEQGQGRATAGGVSTT
jgi:hypothetical protein